MLVGYGWWTHDGAELADTIIVASYNPSLHSVSMLSIPRDLLVITHDNDIGRVNSVLSHAYNSNGRDISQAAQVLTKKVEKITGLTIPYYALVDFDGFIKIIDSIGGVDVYVPEHFIDTQYPVDRNGEYEVFELMQWRNHLSGPNTLKYARSRHSTSDFSRSKRQQTIIKAFFSKLMSSENMSPSKMKELYANYTSIIKTNISLDNLIGLLKYGTTLPEMHSFGYTMQCSNEIWKTMTPWCILRQANGWLLPSSAAWWEIESYTGMQFFADLVAHHQDFLHENIPLTVYNATDKEFAKTLPFGDGLALKTAVKLARYAFNIVQVTNAPSIITGTIVEVYGTGEYTHTIDMLKTFVPVDEVKVMSWSLDQFGHMMTWWLYLYLWNNYLKTVGTIEFNYYK